MHQGQLNLKEPVRHGAIRFVLKEELFATASFVTNNIDSFPATYPRRPADRALPHPMVALAATALRTTGQRQNIAFTEDAYEDTYRNHMASLEIARNQGPVSVHRILHGLFMDIRSSSAFPKRPMAAKGDHSVPFGASQSFLALRGVWTRHFLRSSAYILSVANL
ncbi:hypothetical protein B0H14DRAFT_3474088 [Mycena olivaceomarginata]|nr:hypothetical protein B0H14DRAFT_3474088 [Mycena olivaceomarginata]